MNRLLRHVFIALLIGTGAFYGQTAPRDTSTLEKSLVGHWVSSTGNTHFFFSDKELTMVDLDAKKVMTYAVQESHPTERHLVIRVTTGAGYGHDKKVTFAQDATSIVTEVKFFNETAYTTPEKYTYVDSKQAP